MSIYARKIIAPKKSEFDRATRLAPKSVWGKYTDYKKWLSRDIRIAKKIGLHKETSPLEILDIGCGSGYFCLVSDYFGHNAIGLDIEDKYFDKVSAALGVVKKTEKILPYKKIDINSSFDLIVVSGALFDFSYEDVGRAKVFWSDKMWEFFLRNIHELLRPEGRLFLRLSRGRKNWPDFYSPVLLNAFSCAHQDNNEYLFTKDNLFDVIEYISAFYCTEERRLSMFVKE
ncbi:MAG: methyltransferase domain-containing protein [Pseudomonadota bacterium]|nr:methyltransferase domain-containing protein [Pseudomonadota bacterium]